jgi:hypothetical protein
MPRVVAFALCAALFATAPAAATSLVAVRPHKPERPCGILAATLARLATAKRPEASDCRDAVDPEGPLAISVDQEK